LLLLLLLPAALLLLLLFTLILLSLHILLLLLLLLLSFALHRLAQLLVMWPHRYLALPAAVARSHAARAHAHCLPPTSACSLLLPRFVQAGLLQQMLTQI
jgi:hypothetical protein